MDNAADIENFKNRVQNGVRKLEEAAGISIQSENTLNTLQEKFKPSFRLKKKKCMKEKVEGTIAWYNQYGDEWKRSCSSNTENER